MRALRLQTRVDHKKRIILDLPEYVTQDHVEVIVLLGDDAVGSPVIDHAAADTRERLRRFHEWVDAHDRSVSLIPADMYRREHIYETP
jgi:hypothetical protein